MDALRPLVLVVDDDPTARRMLDVRMRALACRVTMAANAQEALAALAREVPAVIVLDVRLPDMDGLDVLRAIHEHDPTLPVVLVTAHGSADIRAAAVQERAIAYFEKPFDPRRLELVVRGVLERRQTCDGASEPETRPGRNE